MMDVMKLGYRLSPDRRWMQAFASLTALFQGMIEDGASPGAFSAGSGRSDGKTLIIPLMMDKQVAAEIQMALPLDFPALMANSATWITMMATAAGVEPPPQMDPGAMPSLVSAKAEIQGIDPRSILNGLGTLETLYRTHGPQGAILRAAVRGYGYLLMSLFPDRTDGRDRLAAHGVALLTLARWLAPELDLTMEEALLAYQMGYTAHALNLIQGSVFYTADPSDRLLMALIRRDARQLTSSGSSRTDMLRRYLLARLFRELEQPRTAEEASASLADRYPNLLPAMVEAIYSGRRDDANAASGRYLTAILAALEDMATATHQKPPSPGATESPAQPAGTPENLLNRVTWPEVFSEGTIADTSLARQAYRVLYTGAIFLRFQLLLELRDFSEAIRVAENLPADTPLAMTLRAQVLAYTGKHKEAADLAAKIVKDPLSSARLALQAVQLSGENPDRGFRMADVVRRMDDRPGNRFFMASLFQHIGYSDRAKVLYSSGLREHPLHFSAYREPTAVTGTVSPLETALETFEFIPVLHLSTGDFYARQPDPEEAEKSLTHYQRADALAPMEAAPALRAHRVLYRFGRKKEAAKRITAKLDQGQASGTAELRLRFALANTYLDLKRPENALAAVAPIKADGGPVVELVMARVLEFKGD